MSRSVHFDRACAGRATQPRGLAACIILSLEKGHMNQMSGPALRSRMQGHPAQHCSQPRSPSQCFCLSAWWCQAGQSRVAAAERDLEVQEVEGKVGPWHVFLRMPAESYNAKPSKAVVSASREGKMLAQLEKTVVDS